MSVKYLGHPTTLLLKPHTTPFNCHPSWHHRETAVSLRRAAHVYLQSRKPEVPSGPVGCRITWLFGRTGSDGCCVLRRAGLMTRGEMRNKWQVFSTDIHLRHFSSAVTNVDFVVFATVTSHLSWHGLSWGVSSEEALPKILLLASAYSASLWARDFICWEGRDEEAGFPVVPLFVGRFKILICGGGAAGRESSWITMAVCTGEPPEPRLDFLHRSESVREIKF